MAAIRPSRFEYGHEGKADRPVPADTTRLQQLSEEVNRIAASLARFAGSSPAVTTAPPQNLGEATPELSPGTVRQVIRARRLRAKHFAPDLFADPAWDILLDLLQAELIQHRVSVTSLCSAASVPPTTALRWIKNMTEAGMLIRHEDPYDGRRVFIELSTETSQALRNYFAEVGAAATT